MFNRRIYEKIGVRYADVGQVATIVSNIRDMLQEHEDIDTGQTIIVNFESFSASSLDIMVYTFTKTVDWITFHQVKQNVLLKISELIEEQGAEVAFPTRTLHLADKAQADSGHEADYTESKSAQSRSNDQPVAGETPHGDNDEA